jgi:hypothetical protein
MFAAVSRFKNRARRFDTDSHTCDQAPIRKVARREVRYARGETARPCHFAPRTTRTLALRKTPSFSVTLNDALVRGGKPPMPASVSHKW